MPQYISKLILNGVTQMDVTQDTVVASKLFSGETATGADGAPVVGSYVPPSPPKYTATISGAGTRYMRYVRYDSQDYYTNGDTFEYESGDNLYINCEAGPNNRATISIDGVAVVQRTDGGTATYNYTLPANDITITLANTGAVSINSVSGINLQNKTVSITPTTSTQSQTVSADSGYDGLGEVTINTAAMPSGTAGTPTATKGAVSNHAVTVTPSVTNTAGYIGGGTKTGTAVSVSAAELVSGSQTITQNGTVDVTNLASVTVDVSGGGGGARVASANTSLQTASSTITFTGLIGDPSSFIVESDDVLTPAATAQIEAVVYDGANVIGQAITNTSNAQASYISSGLSKTYSNGTLTITSTGTTFAANVLYVLIYSVGGTVETNDVQVGSGATSITFAGLESEPVFWSCIFKSNFGTSSGYQRVIWVSNNGSITIGAALDSTADTGQYWTQSYNNGSLTITSQGTNQGGYFHQPGYYQLTCVYDSGGNYQSKTVTPTTSQQVVEADSEFDALSRVTVNPIPSQYFVPTGNLAITQNGNNIDVAQYSTVSVNVTATGKNAQIAAGSGRATSTSYTAVAGQSLTVAKTGTYDVYWFGYRSSTSGTNGSQLYIGNSAYGNAITTFDSTLTNCQNVHLTNVSLTAGQTITVRARSRGSSYYMYIANLTIIEV